jgi:hypothetical protein
MITITIRQEELCGTWHADFSDEEHTQHFSGHAWQLSDWLSEFNCPRPLLRKYAGEISAQVKYISPK